MCNQTLHEFIFGKLKMNSYKLWTDMISSGLRDWFCSMLEPI